MSLNVNILLMVLMSVLLSRVESRKDKIKLKDVEVLTLTAGKWTTSRRTSAVPQLKCIGGHCDAIKLATVQCYNRGSDGIDVQWECKADMNKNYKFGNVEVVCEGYDYPDDPYILVGSCGLEYSIEPTAERYAYEKPSYSHDSQSNYKQKPMHAFSFGFVITVIVVIFVIYYTCLRQPSSDNSSRADNRTPHSPPPPPGFRSNLFGDSSDYCSGTSSSNTYRTNYQNDNARTAGNNNFWWGMASGAGLGYLFGSRTNTNYADQSSYFGRRAPSSSSFFDSRSTSSDDSSRTASGFGGTRRR